ncbi:MAG TPA: hypothetical protein VLA48_01840 [Nitrososphaeraceae archaeon]|nr:hypothetical protein [Nitrososphaeraceae archaeon]
MLKINSSIKTTVITSIIVTLFFSIFSSSSSESFAQNTNSLSNNNIKKSEITSSCELTVPTVQGPYYKEGSPIKEGEEFAKGIEGEKLVVAGKVLGSINCNPVNSAILDFWQADSKGQYDNEGFNLRGKIISDENGNYRLDTILPASYSEGNITRPAHIHVKAWIPENPGNPALVTQLYFEGDPNMDIFVKEPLIMKIVDKNGTKFANFNFVLEDYRDFG